MNRPLWSRSGQRPSSHLPLTANVPIILQTGAHEALGQLRDRNHSRRHMGSWLQPSGLAAGLSPTRPSPLHRMLWVNENA